jgi:hypothetical protein
MARIFSSDNKSSSRTVRNIFLLMIITLIMVVPVGVTGNEDLQVVDSSAGTASDSMLGWNITEIGDVDRDGLEDYAVGAPGIDRVYIFKGSLNRPFTIAGADWTIRGDSSTMFGWSVSGIGDYDNDGRDDIIIGAPQASKAFVYRGGSFSSPAIQLNGTSGDLFGHAVAGIDYSGTSHYYAVVGAPQNNHFLGTVGYNVTTGAVFLFNLSYMDTSGLDYMNYTFANFTFNGEHNNGWFGFTVANLGTVNDDTIPDLGIGDPYYNNTGDVDNGALYIQYGKDIIMEQPLLTASRLDGSIRGRSQSRFGWFVKGVQDVSPTPNHDFIVGAPFENNAGYAHLFYGKTSAFDLQLSAVTFADVEFQGTENRSRFGWSADRTMISGSSQYVITIGAPLADNGTKADAGALFSYWQWAGSETDQTAMSKFYGENAEDNLGYSICEVVYRGTGPSWVRIMASSPYHGNTNTGLVEIFQRNELPTIQDLQCSPRDGNMNTDFTIKIIYADPDGDPPEYVDVNIYQYKDDLQPEITLRLNQSNGIYTSGMNYTITTKLPNSVLDKQTANKELWINAITRAREVPGISD